MLNTCIIREFEPKDLQDILDLYKELNPRD